MQRISFFFLILLVLASCKKDETPASDNNTPTTPALPEAYAALEGLFEGEGIGAAVNLTQDVVILFNMDGDRYVWLEDGEIQAEFNITDEGNLFEDCLFDHIGAATVTNNARVYVYDEDGEHYTYANFDPDEAPGAWNDESLLSWSEDSWNVELWGTDYTNPFNSIGCMWNFSNYGSGCFDAYEDSYTTWMVKGNGKEIVQYYNNGAFAEPMDIEYFTAENNCGGPDGLLPFERIGAAFRIVYPNMIQDVIFNFEGTHFCYYSVSEGVVSEPYSIY